MISARTIALGGLVAAFLSACAATMGVPEIESNFAPQTRNADWPGFLPIDVILSDDPVDFARYEREVRHLQARAAALRSRARLLKAPVPEAQERLAASRR